MNDLIVGVRPGTDDGETLIDFLIANGWKLHLSDLTWRKE